MQNNYKNFNGLINKKVNNYYVPENIEQLKNIIIGNDKISVVGSIHAFNEISYNKHAMVDMSNFKEIKEINLEDKLITVQSGIKLYELLDELKKYNLTLPVLPSISNISLAGGISTGTHGSNVNNGSLSSIVKSMNIILANGESKFIDETDEDFRAVICGLGCLGIIENLTIRCTDIFRVSKRKVEVNWNYLNNHLENLLKTFEYTYLQVHQFDDNLKTDVFLIKKISHITPSSADSRVATPQNETLDYKLDGVVTSRKEYEQSDLMTNKNFSKYIETELAFDYKDLNSAIIDISKFHKKYSKKYEIMPDDILLVRFLGADYAFLSMASERKTVFISTFFDAPDPSNIKKINVIYKFLKKLCDEMIYKYGARPHHGKINSLNKEKMELLYPNFDKFMQTKNKCDPENKFTNSHLEMQLFHL